MRRWLRFTLIGAGAVTLTAVAAGVLFAVTFDPNTQKTRIVEAVRRATGRDLVLAGPLRLSLGWTPVLEAEDAAPRQPARAAPGRKWRRWGGCRRASPCCRCCPAGSRSRL